MLHQWEYFCLHPWPAKHDKPVKIVKDSGCQRAMAVTTLLFPRSYIILDM